MEPHRKKRDGMGVCNTYLSRPGGGATTPLDDLFPCGVDPRNPKRRSWPAPVPLLSRAAVRDRGPVSQLAGAGRPRDDRRMITAERAQKFANIATSAIRLGTSLIGRSQVRLPCGSS